MIRADGTMVHDDGELLRALRVVEDAGLDVVVKESYASLLAWVRESKVGMPPAGWKPRAKV